MRAFRWQLACMHCSCCSTIGLQCLYLFISSVLHGRCGESFVALLTTKPKEQNYNKQWLFPPHNHARNTNTNQHCFLRRAFTTVTECFFFFFCTRVTMIRVPHVNRLVVPLADSKMVPFSGITVKNSEVSNVQAMVAVSLGVSRRRMRAARFFARASVVLLGFAIGLVCGLFGTRGSLVGTDATFPGRRS